jgi:hypothetical protein
LNLRAFCVTIKPNKKQLRGLNMRKNELIEILIGIKDYYRGDLTRRERDAINEACNIIKYSEFTERSEES